MNTAEFDELRAILHRVDQRLEAIETRLNSLPPQRHDEVRRLIPALVGAVGSETFTATDPLEYPAVLSAISRPLTPESLGQLLGRAAGHVIDGYRIERLGRGRWRVVRIV
jgi:hypothetical protein